MTQPAKRTRAVTEAISALLVQQPFFASLMLDLLNVEETEHLPDGKQLNTAATDGRTLWINPKEFEKLTVPERIGVLAHEVMHVILQHTSRRYNYEMLGVGPDLKKFSGKKFNHAADYIINAYLISLGFKLPMGTLQNSQVGANDILDEVYLKLPDEEENEDDGWDQHESAPPDQLANKPAVQAAVKKAQEIAKMQGEGTGGMQRLIDDICEPQVPWYEFMRKAITTQVRGRDTHTWARPNRRKLAVPPHAYWPGRSGLKGPGIAVEIDTSGSIGEQELKTFLGELSGILTDMEPERVYVMYVDDKVHNDEIIEIDDVNDLAALGQKAGGGGGTDMTVIFDEIKKRELPVEMAIILTDGYTPFGEDTGLPTIWAITTDKVAPWGTTVHVKIPAAK